VRTPTVLVDQTFSKGIPHTLHVVCNTEKIKVSSFPLEKRHLFKRMARGEKSKRKYRATEVAPASWGRHLYSEMLREPL
jgi:hypothetical protein